MGKPYRPSFFNKGKNRQCNQFKKRGTPVKVDQLLDFIRV